jgi:O-antigen/teichoic acid export membrane protein
VSFIVGTALWNVFVLEDSVLAGLRRARWVPVENVSYSVVKLVLLALFASAGWSIGIFVSWVLPAAMAAVVITALLVYKLRDGAGVKRDDALEMPSLRRSVRLSVGNQIGLLAIVGASSLMPVLIVNELGAAPAARFYAAWTIGSVLPLVASSFSMSLTVEGARSGRATGRLVREAIIGTCAVLVPIVIVIVLTAPWLLGLFGKSYSDDATTVVRLLALAAIPNVVVGVSQGVARIRDRVGIIAASQSFIAVLTIGVMAVLLRPLGIAAGGIAWLVGQTVGAAILWGVVIHGAVGSDGRSGLLAPRRMIHMVRRRRSARVPELGASPDAVSVGDAELGPPVSAAVDVRDVAAAGSAGPVFAGREPFSERRFDGRLRRLVSTPQQTSSDAGSVVALDTSAPAVHTRVTRELKPDLPRARWALLGAIAITAALGTVLVAIAYVYGRENWSLDFGRGLLWIGLACIYIPVFARMLSPAATRAERLALVFIAAALLYVVKVLHNPTSFGEADEFLHFANAQNILRWGRLYTPNSLFDVSASYPGLPSLAAATSLLTGLSLFVSSLLVVGVARVVLLIALFLVAERLANSARIAGVAALLYCAHPFYLMWSSQFAYESLSVPLVGAILVCLLAKRPGDREPSAVWTGAAVLLIAATAITHHVTSYVLVFVLWALFALTVWARRPNRRYLAFAIAATACTAAWLLAHGQASTAYLGSNLKYASASVAAVIKHQEAAHTPFGGGTSPTPPDELILTAVGLLVVVASTLRGGFLLLRAKGRRLAQWMMPDTAGALMLMLALVGVAWIGTYALRLAPGAWLLGSRTSDFVFAGAALLMAWAATAYAGGGDSPRVWATRGGAIEVRVARRSHVTLRRAVVAICAGAAVLGGTAVGSDSYSRLARPTQVRVGDRDISPQSAAVAAWATQNLPRTASIAADASSGRLLLDDGFRRVIANAGTIGELMPTTLISGDWKRDLIAENAIDYVIVDRRPSSADPGLGLTYRRPDERPERLYPARAVRDFDEMRGARRVFDSGDIVVFDVTKVRRPGQRVRRTFVAAAPRQPREKRWLSLMMIAVALVVLALTLAVAGARRLFRLPERQDRASRLDASTAVAVGDADAQQRPSRAVLTETIAVTCGLIALAVSFVASGPEWLTATLGLAMVFVLPGHAVMSLLFGRSQPSTAERLVVGVALSIATIIVTMVALDAAGQRINRFSLLSTLVALQVVALTTALIRAPARRVLLRPLRPRWPRLRPAISVALVVAVVVSAVGVAVAISVPARATTRVSGYSALWVERNRPRAVTVGVESNEVGPASYKVEARAGERVLAVRSLSLAPGHSMQLTLPFGDQRRPVIVSVQQREGLSGSGRYLAPPLWLALGPRSTSSPVP